MTQGKAMNRLERIEAEIARKHKAIDRVMFPIVSAIGIAGIILVLVAISRCASGAIYCA